jgi:eukaryotic-like serine/threonine-protein kinase
MIIVKIDHKKYLTSSTAKKLYIGLSLVLVLFILVNDFILPWYVDGGGTHKVPIVVGMKFEDAAKFLDSLGFESRKGDVRLDREHPAGIVVIQNPIADAIVKKGRRIYLTISGGEVMIAVPDLKGRTLRDARFMLERDGLKLGAIEYQPSDEFPENTVIEQKINPGVKVKRDVYVSITVSQGSIAEKITVPDVTGKTVSDAVRIFTVTGLRLGKVTYVPASDLLPNTVVDQSPRVGEMVPKGQEVDLFVVQGNEKKNNLFEN